jgi:hypothetical protein
MVEDDSEMFFHFAAMDKIFLNKEAPLEPGSFLHFIFF